MSKQWVSTKHASLHNNSSISKKEVKRISRSASSPRAIWLNRWRIQPKKNQPSWKKILKVQLLALCYRPWVKDKWASSPLSYSRISVRWTKSRIRTRRNLCLFCIAILSWRSQTTTRYHSRRIARAFCQRPWSYLTKILPMIRARRMLRHPTSRITRRRFWITRRRRQTFRRIYLWSCFQIRCWWRSKTNAFSSVVGSSTASRFWTQVRCCAGVMVAQAALAMATTGPSKTQNGSKPSPKRAYTSRQVDITM